MNRAARPAGSACPLASPFPPSATRCAVGARRRRWCLTCGVAGSGLGACRMYSRGTLASRISGPAALPCPACMPCCSLSRFKPLHSIAWRGDSPHRSLGGGVPWCGSGSSRHASGACSSSAQPAGGRGCRLLAQHMRLGVVWFASLRASSIHHSCSADLCMPCLGVIHHASCAHSPRTSGHCGLLHGDAAVRRGFPVLHLPFPSMPQGGGRVWTACPHAPRQVGHCHESVAARGGGAPTPSCARTPFTGVGGPRRRGAADARVPAHQERIARPPD